MLEVQNLAVRYQRVCAVNSVSFTVAPGQLVGVIGPNGAGKSTMIKGMLGLIATCSGVVKFRSRPLKQQLKQVAYIPQRSQIDWDYPITVWNAVMMARTVHTGWFKEPNRQSQEIVKAALARVGMWELHQRQIGELSGGQQQRVFLARALAQQAELLFFDEPFTGIDKKTEEIVFEIFSELKAQNKTLLVIGHDLGENLSYYDRFLLMNKHLIADGSRAEVLTAANLQKAYGQLTMMSKFHVEFSN
ncbi:metal ABC transporter ATP-binding protein [Planktothrix sp. FACHB-1355]|uniref:Metal ABC transporter ATP-binding protein n=1 Tax=Aerosakkonema funiforme FACHB-1375 TaxID=2949571 RepID=A0A926VHJ6_9CYAN|nr:MULTISPECIES: metal ABC transporter ATP-binding protein [Oscillatoriales]MBD2184036.1 metal ABC transporter ATP-binding protein [Aerosakkonema funiforme FACHB-1375]MBD3563347.1 metal ABC transporter ATP-binding protein [Planktothrix sp. FACHB-1355]